MYVDESFRVCIHQSSRENILKSCSTLVVSQWVRKLPTICWRRVASWAKSRMSATFIYFISLRKAHLIITVVC